jgi:hypothetical protein
VSESWQAAKHLHEIDADDLSPMWANWEGASHRHFYVKEIAQCADGTYVVPLKWIIYQKQVHADSYLVTREPVRSVDCSTLVILNQPIQSGVFTVEEHEVVRVVASNLRYNFLDLQQQGEIIFSGMWTSRTSQYFESC